MNSNLEWFWWYTNSINPDMVRIFFSNIIAQEDFKLIHDSFMEFFFVNGGVLDSKVKGYLELGPYFLTDLLGFLYGQHHENINLSINFIPLLDRNFNFIDDF